MSKPHVVDAVPIEKVVRGVSTWTYQGRCRNCAWFTAPNADRNAVSEQMSAHVSQTARE